jgi:hypothetical protein
MMLPEESMATSRTESSAEPPRYVENNKVGAARAAGSESSGIEEVEYEVEACGEGSKELRAKQRLNKSIRNRDIVKLPLK